MSLSNFRRALAAVLLAGVLPAQTLPTRDGPDLRDRVTRTNGKVVRGRVFSRYSPDEIVVVQGGHRQRVSRRKIRDIHTIDDDLREFFAHRAKVGKSTKRSWFLVEWAASKKLDGMAQLQALSILFDDPAFDQAHEFLGHKLHRKRGWLWRRGRRFVTLDKFDEHHAKWGTALQLVGEHFKVKTDAGVRRAVQILFDLERFYLFWDDTFGEALEMQESLRPIEVQVWSSMFKFPSTSARKLPYYDVRGDHCATYFAPDGKRPKQLFAVATQNLIYRTLVGSAGGVRTTHLCAWAEIGLGEWMESAFGGKPGQAVPLPRAVLGTMVASTVLRLRPKLKMLTHMQYDLYYELSRRAGWRWEATTSLVHYLMSEKPDPKVRKKFMRYLKLAFRKGLGDSSSAFDKAMGERVEKLQPKFFRWLQVHRN